MEKRISSINNQVPKTLVKGTFDKEFISLINTLSELIKDHCKILRQGLIDSKNSCNLLNNQAISLQSSLSEKESKIKYSASTKFSQSLSEIIETNNKSLNTSKLLETNCNYFFEQARRIFQQMKAIHNKKIQENPLYQYTNQEQNLRQFAYNVLSFLSNMQKLQGSILKKESDVRQKKEQFELLKISLQKNAEDILSKRYNNNLNKATIITSVKNDLEFNNKNEVNKQLEELKNQNDLHKLHWTLIAKLEEDIKNAMIDKNKLIKEISSIKDMNQMKEESWSKEKFLLMKTIKSLQDQVKSLKDELYHKNEKIENKENFESKNLKLKNDDIISNEGKFQNEIKFLKEENNKLFNEAITLRSMIEAKSKELAKEKEKYNMQSIQLEESNKEIYTKETSIAKINENDKNKEKEYSELNKKYLSSLETIKELKEQMDNSNNEHQKEITIKSENATKELDSIKRQLNEALKTNKSLNETNKVLQDAIKDKDNFINSENKLKTNRINILETEKKNSDIYIKQLKEQNDKDKENSNNEIKLLQNKLQKEEEKNKNEVKLLKTQIENEKSKYNNDLKDIQLLKSELQSKETENAKLNVKVEELQKEKDTEENIIKNLKEEIEKEKMINSNTAQSNNKNIGIIQNIQKLLEKEKKEHQKTKSDLDEQVKKFNYSEMILQKEKEEHQRTKNELEENKKEKVLLKNKIKSNFLLNNQTQNQSEDNKKVLLYENNNLLKETNDLKQLKEENTKNIQQIKILMTQLDKEKKNNNELNQMLKNANNEITEMKEQQEKGLEGYKILLNLNEKEKEENKSMRSENDKLRNEIKSIQKENQSLKESIEKVNKDYAEKEKLMNSLMDKEASLKKENKKIKETYEKIIENSKMQVDSLVKENERKNDQIKRLNESLKSSNVDINTLNNLETELQSQKKREDDLIKENKNKILEYLSQIKVKEDIIKEKDKEISKCQNLIKTNHIQIAKLNGIISDNENKISNLENINKENILKIGNYEDIIKDNKMVISNYEQKEKIYKETLSIGENEKGEIKAELEKEIEILKTKLINAQSALITEKNDNNQELKQNDIKESFNSIQNEQYNEKIKELECEIKVLKEKIILQNEQIQSNENIIKITNDLIKDKDTHITGYEKITNNLEKQLNQLKDDKEILYNKNNELEKQNKELEKSVSESETKIKSLIESDQNITTEKQKQLLELRAKNDDLQRENTELLKKISLLENKKPKNKFSPQTHIIISDKTDHPYTWYLLKATKRKNDYSDYIWVEAPKINLNLYNTFITEVEMQQNLLQKAKDKTEENGVLRTEIEKLKSQILNLSGSNTKPRNNIFSKENSSNSSKVMQTVVSSNSQFNFENLNIEKVNNQLTQRSTVSEEEYQKFMKKYKQLLDKNANDESIIKELQKKVHNTPKIEGDFISPKIKDDTLILDDIMEVYNSFPNKENVYDDDDVNQRLKEQLDYFKKDSQDLKFNLRKNIEVIFKDIVITDKNKNAIKGIFRLLEYEEEEIHRKLNEEEKRKPKGKFAFFLKKKNK